MSLFSIFNTNKEKALGDWFRTEWNDALINREKLVYTPAADKF